MFFRLLLSDKDGVHVMQYISQGYKGFSLLVRLNADRFIMLGALVAELYLGSYLALV